MDNYTTVCGTATATLTEKKSEFIAQLSFADTEEAALRFLQQVKAAHRTANHNVYAYLLRADARMRYSDDGEPAKTAGLPVLEVIRHAGIVDCVVVVTRYFGGTLLGTGGLVRAYTGAAQMALAAAQKVTVSVCVRGTLCVEYPVYESAARMITQAGAKMEAPLFAEKVTLHFVMLAGAQEPLTPKLQELCRGKAEITYSQPYYAPF